MTVPAPQFDGPRLATREECLASEKLFRTAFGFPAITPEEEKEVLARCRAHRPRGTYVVAIAHEGELVSQLAVYHNEMRIYGATTRVASIGGVGTHPDYRGKGLATQILNYTAARLVQDGARLMLISGGRGLYTRLGNVPPGRYVYFSIKPGDGRSWRPAPADLVLRRMHSADAPLLARLYQAEPIHYVRTSAAFSHALDHPSGAPYLYADQWVVERLGQAVAYLFLGCPYHEESGEGIRYVSEYAGSRTALADALGGLLAAGDLQRLDWPVAWQDRELIGLLQDSGCRGFMGPLDGHTLRIVDFPGLMRDLRPILRARLGADLLRGLRFEQTGSLLGGTGTDRYAIVRGADRLELDGADMTRLVMGTAESDAPPARYPGALAEVIPAVFPLPSFLPGLNYR